MEKGKQLKSKHTFENPSNKKHQYIDDDHTKTKAIHKSHKDDKRDKKDKKKSKDKNKKIKDREGVVSFDSEEELVESNLKNKATNNNFVSFEDEDDFEVNPSLQNLKKNKHKKNVFEDNSDDEDSEEAF